MLERLIPPWVVALAVATAAGAVFAFGWHAGHKSGVRVAVEAVQRATEGRDQCMAELTSVSDAVKRQNAAVQAQADAAERAKAKAEAAARAAATEASAYRARADRITKLKPAGSECEKASALLAEYAE